MKAKLRQLLQERILILDGATGTKIQQKKLGESDFRGKRFSDLQCAQLGNNDLLVLTQPEIIRSIHRDYLEAGADIITTNTFNAQRISQKDYCLESLVKEINFQAARLAKEVAEEFTKRNPQKPRFVAGSIGPTNQSLSLSPDAENPAYRALDFDSLKEAYAEQISELIRGGVDILLLETIFDTMNAKAALLAAQEVFDVCGKELPIMLSITIADKSGRMLAGQSIQAFLASIPDMDILSVGLNCSFGARQLKPYLEELTQTAPYFVSVHPNAGLPNEIGEYDEPAEEFAATIAEFIKEGIVNIVGGCCGTTEKHIKMIDDFLNNQELTTNIRLPKEKSTLLKLSGLDVLEVSSERNFVNIGERCNVAGSRKFLRLIKEKNYDEAISIARGQVEAGAQVIDINFDDGLLNAEEEMSHFLNLLSTEPEISRHPFMIDSSNWKVIQAALKCIQGKCIVNSISLKEGEAAFLRKAEELKRYGAAVVVMAFDEEGQATSRERKIEICRRAYRLLVNKAKFNPAEIIFDPNILAICTGISEHDNYAKDFLEATEWIRKNLTHAHVSGGVSNLSFAFRGNNYLREALHAVFLYQAIQTGMDMGIVNPASKVQYDDIEPDLLHLLEDTINNIDGAADKLIDKAQSILEEKNHKEGNISSVKDNSDKDVDERLSTALQTGRDENLSEDIRQAIEKYGSATQVIEKPLMAGMDVVGEKFAEGKMFLPQVVKAARTMKKAVECLQPYMTQDSADVPSCGKILLATVKGDVHDIGKNICSLVLQCNHYHIKDLGVMVPAEDIISTAKALKVDAVGICGLITPSLNEMIHVAQSMQAAELKIPLLIGGATTSRLHTALKIAPHYDAPVIWTKDASQLVLTMSKLQSSSARQELIEKNAIEQENLRKEKNNQHYTPLISARNEKLQLF